MRLVRLLADGCWHSGEDLAQTLGVSRTAVWKHLQRLREWGVDVHAVNGAGYRLTQPLEMLDAQIIHDAMPAPERRIPIDVFSTVDSTNTYLMGRELEESGRVCLAEYQKHGRGRRGRFWISPFGANLCLSVGWRIAETTPDMALLPLAVGIGCAGYLRDRRVKHIGLKWPNDLVINGAKVGGILVEHGGEAGGPWRVVVGVGINVCMTAAQAEFVDQPWTGLNQGMSARDSSISRNVLAAGLIACILQVRASLEGAGLAHWLKRWHEFDVLRGAHVEVSGARDKATGIARGVDADGTLIVDTAAGQRRFFSGEVKVRAKEPAMRVPDHPTPEI